jgi:DNA-binding beta-propeller fold protein YncE
VRRIDLTNSTVSTVCGGSWGVPGTSATQSGVDVKMKEPIGVAFNTVNNKLYVTEWSNHTIREIEP